MTNKEIFYGTVDWFNAQKGYGFINWSDNEGNKQEDMFVHFSDINCEGFKTLHKEQKVSFEVGVNRDGEPKAVNVVVLRN
jgi:CspA family cold shock protein